MLSPLAVPQTTLSPFFAVPHTTLSPSAVPHTTLSQSAPPQSVPHTTLSPPSAVPQTTLSPPAVPQTTLSPLAAIAAPQVVPRLHAFASGSTTPPVRRWLPQMIRLPHISCIGKVWPGCA